MQVMIYNGDADACVPYIGNEEWINDALVSRAFPSILLYHIPLLLCFYFHSIVPRFAQQILHYQVGPGLITEAAAWRPWFTADTPDMPAGYVTTYSVADSSPAQTMTFLTIRLAGHMVPMFQPGPALTFFERFLAGEPQ